MSKKTEQREEAKRGLAPKAQRSRARAENTIIEENRLINNNRVFMLPPMEPEDVQQTLAIIALPLCKSRAERVAGPFASAI